jgi:hypothetical protein
VLVQEDAQDGGGLCLYHTSMRECGITFYTVAAFDEQSEAMRCASCINDEMFELLGSSVRIRVAEVGSVDTRKEK